MTDTSSTALPLPTAASPPFLAPAALSPSPSLAQRSNGAPAAAAPRDRPDASNGHDEALPEDPELDDDEEPYTIKCICAFEDDDGSTVLCERCDTWQHIACYYIDKRHVPDIHNCVDCEPRNLDGKRATERQRKLRDQSDAHQSSTAAAAHAAAAAAAADDQRKGRRSTGAPKAQRASRKPKEKDLGSPAADQQRNGWAHERSASSSSNQPPAKKQRTAAHRASNSVSSLAGDARAAQKRGNGGGKQLLPQIPLYSPEFLRLYDNDNASLDMQGNLFRSIGLTNDLASWVKDPLALAHVANGRSPRDVFHHTDHPLDPAAWPPLSKQTVVDSAVDFDGRHPTWQFLRVQSPVRKDEIVGEVRGKVGHLRDYCHDPDSRWQELRHPEPFVFFHPQLPIYIDSREEGTVLRYIRRSCRPNVTMRTYITNQVEYHFCFVANQDIPVDAEISTTWYLDPKMFPSNGLAAGGDSLPDDQAAVSISNVLAHFGGCACDDSLKPCLLANIDCRVKPKQPDSGSGGSGGATKQQANGRRKKAAKAKSAASPDSSAGYVAAHSRSGSELVRNQDDDDHADARSTSGSLKDHPANRDLTPGSLGRDTGELSAREKRKIAAAEKKFEQLEHDQHHPKKKKRVNPRGQSPNLKSAKPPHLDIPQSRRSSHSPAKMSPESASRRDGPFSATVSKASATSTPRIVSPLTRPLYVDCSVQTDPDENDPHFVPQKSFNNAPRFMTLTQRLLKRCHEDRIKMEETGRDVLPVVASPSSLPVLASPSSSPPDVVPGTMLPPSTPVSARPASSADVEMKDADSSMTPPGTSPTSHSPPPPRPLFHLPSTVAHNMPSPLKVKPVLLPPPPALSQPGIQPDIPQSEIPQPEIQQEVQQEVPEVPEVPDAQPETPQEPSQPEVKSEVKLPSEPSQPEVKLPSEPSQPEIKLPPEVQLPEKLPPEVQLPPEKSPPEESPSEVRPQPVSPDSAKPALSKPAQPKLQTSTAAALTAPSPVKKKLSLNDYMSRRGTLTTPTTEKAPNPFLPSSTSPAPSPSTGSADPSPTTQFPITKLEPDVVMKDSLTLFPDPNSTNSNSNTTNTHNLSRDPRLLDRG